jgi:hypothetical protein
MALSRAEQILGRPITPVIYTKERFLEKRNERDPFLMQVLKGEKILLGGTDDELRALASKSVHHQARGNGARAASATQDR